MFPILPVRADKLDYVFGTCSYKPAFATVSIPMERFVPEDEGIDLTAITAVSFVFDGSGQAALDNIGLEARRPFQ